MVSRSTLGLILAVVLIMPLVTKGQNAQLPPAKTEPAPSATNRLTIEVTAGDDNRRVENASVYVKAVEEHAIKKNKKFEVNVKTNEQGIAHVPSPPMGKVLVQVVAEGWKTFGRWYDITDSAQVIKIHLERPPKWY